MLGTREVEQRLLGALMVYDLAIHGVMDALKKKHFSNAVNAEIFEIMRVMAHEGTPIDKAIIFRRFASPPQDMDLSLYLARLYAEAPAENQIQSLVDELVDAEMRRSAIVAFEEAARAMETAQDARSHIEQVQGGLARILSTVRVGGGQIGRLADKLLTEAWAPAAERPKRIKSGLQFLDRVIGNMAPADLIFLGGAPSAGKSALAGQAAFSIAERAGRENPDIPGQMLGVPVLYLSLEMEPEEITGRILASRAGVPLWKIEQNEQNDAEAYEITQHQRALDSVPLYVESIAKATPEALLAIVMKFQKTHGIGIVFVDHMHYVRSSNRKLGRFEAIEDVVMELKANAKLTKIPWFCLAHVNNRDLARRPDKRPHMTDLFGASEIEKSADIVCFVHREAYWMQRDEPKKGTPEHDNWFRELYGTGGTPEYPGSDGLYGKAEIYLEKKRKGRGVATCTCEFDEALTVFR